MHDEVMITANELTVTTNNSVQAFKKIFCWVLLALIGLVLVLAVTKTGPPAVVVFIIPLVLLLLYYKFVYLRFNSCSKNTPKLFVSNEQIKVLDDIYTYIIPIEDVVDIEDRSFHYDFQGRKQNGWKHAFAIKLRSQYHTLRVSQNKEVYLDENDPLEIVVSNLVLSHDNYERVVNRFRELLING